MIKIIFSDFDNTLMDYYSDKNYFDEYQVNVIRKVRDMGIKFCIVSGRSVSFFEQFPNLMEVVDYILGSNGACIYDVKNNEYIYVKLIEEEELKKLIDYSIDNNISFVLNCLDKRYKYGNWNRVKALDYEDGIVYNCEQIILSLNKKYSDDVVKYIEYYDNIVINNVASWDDEYSFDINDKSISKGSSIKWLCEQFDIDKDDAIGFGDGVNDVSMFEAVGKSIVMKNAHDSVKSQADDVTLSCYEDGVFKYIEDNILK